MTPSRITICLGIAFIWAYGAYAEQREVSASSCLNLHRKRGDSGYKCLKSGTKLTILKTKGKWSYVKTGAGKKGWVSTKYTSPISDRPRLPAPTENVPSDNIQAELAMDQARSELALGGLKKTIATHYQSCSPLDAADKRPQSVLQGNSPPTRMCEDRSRLNLAYMKGGIAKIVWSGGEQRIDAKRRYWCSGFTGTSLAAAGLRIRKNGNRLDQPVTADIHKIVFGRDGLPPINEGRVQVSDNSCLKVPLMTANSTLMPGDLINTSANHIVQILSVGSDPLGLKGRRTVADCNRISQYDFDFEIAHSTSVGGISGVQITSARKAATSNVRHLVTAARQVCKDLIQRSFTQPKVFKWGKSYADSGTSSYFSILRTRSEDASCTFTPLKLAGEECVNKCLADRRRFEIAQATSPLRKRTQDPRSESRLTVR